MTSVSLQRAGADGTDRGLWAKLAPTLVVLVAGGAALLYAFKLAGRHPASCPAHSMLLLEFAGAEHAKTAYECWNRARPTLSEALLWDTVAVIPIYLAFLSYWCRQARRTAITLHATAIARAATAAVWLAVLFDLAENASLWQLDRSGGTDRTTANGALAFSLPKWILVGFVTGVAVQSVFRTITFARARPTPVDREVFRANQGLSAWERNTRLPEQLDGPANTGPAHGIGVAFSGGGIRSASFGIGALQALHSTPLTGPVGTLDDVRYISGVSGGGYLVAARQLLLDSDPTVEPFLGGSYEVEYVRRHGKYIADSAPEWIEAFARVLAGVALNIGFLVAVLYVIATPAGWLQRWLLFRTFDDTFRTSPAMWASVGLTLGIAGFAYLVGVLARPKGDTEGVEIGSKSYKLSAIFALTGVTCLALVFLLPWVADLTTRLIEVLKVGSATVAAGGGTLSAVATWIGLRPPTRKTLSRLLTKEAKTDSPNVDESTKKTEHLKRRTWAEKVHLSRWLPGLLLILTAVFVLARFVARARRVGAGEKIALWGLRPGREMALWLGVTAVLILLFALADQTTWSLHPYYKRRLATAFAMRRLGGRDVVRRPYKLPTHLDEAGDAKRGPSLILGAAANLSGEHAPPGRRALAFVFTPEWIGGSEIGYATPAAMRAALGARNTSDTTLVAAMAISGAALASAMGRHSLGSLNAVMATFNLRLGVWLPSPTHIDRMSFGDLPPPGLRRLTYVIRELFGSYDVHDRFLYVTDGGHVENLGVVELLRRRCKTVFCFDGSGGPLTLLEGIRLAYEELGVDIEFPAGGYALAREGSVSANRGFADHVAARMAVTSVMIGKITYPRLADDLPESTGTFVYARSVLTPATSAEILDHASRNPRFPNDPTGDQWFDVDQFNTYVALGQEIGAAALAALEDSSPV
jgi:patatin-like phospholipase